MSARFRASRAVVQVRGVGDDRERSDHAAAVKVSLAGLPQDDRDNTVLIR